MKECNDDEDSGDGAFDEREERDLPFGPWLRASPMPKQNYESRKESLYGSCSKNLFASSSSSHAGASSKSKEESEVGPTPKMTEKAEPTLAQIMGRGKVAANDVEEVAESLRFIDLTPKAIVDKKNRGTSPVFTPKANVAKPKSKQRTWVRQKGRNVNKAKGIETKAGEMGKRQLADVDPPDGMKDNEREDARRNMLQGRMLVVLKMNQRGYWRANTSYPNEND